MSVDRTEDVLTCALRGPAHVVERANFQCQRLVGEDRKLVGIPIFEALPEPIAQALVAILDQVYHSGQPYLGDETAIRLDDGEGRFQDAFLTFVYQPFRSAEGAAIGVDVLGFNVTAQVVARDQAESAAREGQRRADELRTVVDSIPLLVSFVTPDKRYGVVNKAYEDWFGLERGQVVGQKVRDVIGESAYPSCSNSNSS